MLYLLELPRICRISLLALGMLPAVSFGREILYLTNGFTLEAASHTARGEFVIVQTSTGTFEVPLSTVERFETLAEPVIVQGPSAKTDGAAAIAITKVDPELVLANAASAQGLAASFVRSVAKVESNLRQDAVSPVGAIGLMQLMPGTAAELGVSPKDAGQNAAGGAQYLRQLLLQYHGDAALALAAYNAGPAAVEKYHGVPPYGETRRYVVRVLQEYVAEQKKAKAQAQLKIAKDAKSRPAPVASASATLGR